MTTTNSANPLRGQAAVGGGAAAGDRSNPSQDRSTADVEAPGGAVGADGGVGTEEKQGDDTEVSKPPSHIIYCLRQPRPAGCRLLVR